ncbi:MAG: hypothetical protein Q8R67_22340 [Rhodoferax sp.]|nr:hypothetical protein [Rhodoferax sp.]MDP3654413.1 hypothetical protein [Rhodoferax sp.]
MARIVEHRRQDLHGDNAGLQALRRLVSLGLFCVLSAVSASSGALGLGAYRCASFNAGGAGGRCTSAPPIELRADGSYTESSTTGRYTVRDGQIIFSESTVRGPGELIDDNAFRFQYTYKGLAHTSTYRCFGCSGAAASAPAQQAKGTASMRVGVTLHIEFSEAVAGATSFAIVPRELASQFRHHAALPAGAVSGLVIDVSQSEVRLATNRNNQLVVGQPYVVFLVYPAETVAVAAFHLPAVKSDFEGRLKGGIYRSGLPLASYSTPPSVNDPPPLAIGGGMESGPGADYPPAIESVLESPYPPPGAPPQGSATTDAPADPAQALEGFVRALKHIGALFNALGQSGQAAPVGAAPLPGSYPAPSDYPAPALSGYPPPSAYPAPPSEAPSGYPPAPATALGVYPSAPSAVSAPKCNPNIPKYTQPGCAE